MTKKSKQRRKSPITRKNEPRVLLPKRPCDYCGTIFQPKRDWHRFHKPECRRRYWKDMANENVVLRNRIDKIESKLGMK